MTRERDYVLGTHDAEVERLGLQHAVWRPRAHAAWQRAGFTLGQRILDVGCGPGYAAADLGELVGPSGKVIGVDRSQRFLTFARARARARNLDWLAFHEQDLDEGNLPVTEADGAWCRWVFAFVRRPRELLNRVREALAPGGVLVLHEYFHYATWRLAPRSEPFERFVAAVMTNWRAAGGEPDITLQLHGWLRESGFAIESMQPIVDAVTPRDFAWHWPAAFVRGSLSRLVESGHLAAADADAVQAVLDEYELQHNGLMFTPGVLEIVARRR